MQKRPIQCRISSDNFFIYDYGVKLETWNKKMTLKTRQMIYTAN